MMYNAWEILKLRLFENIISHFKFNKQERSGIFFLLFIIVFLQVGYYIYGFFNLEKTAEELSIDRETQTQIELLKQNASRKDTLRLYPFNPNFISDYKGYTLGMSVDEIDRLQAFRGQNKYVNSAQEFQKVTLVSDSLLQTISPYFKFPAWTSARNETSSTSSNLINPDDQPTERLAAIKDLNAASEEDLMAIYGIGKVLAERIIKFRDRLGGFLVASQLYDVYGLEADVAERILQKFEVLAVPQINKININTASVAEMVKLVYLRYAVAQEIVAYREKNGGIGSFDELKQIEGFPSDKIDRITLYLSL